MIKKSFDGKEHCGSGTCSQITFDNPEFYKALKSMFGVIGNEKIVAIELDENTIKAFFELQ